MDQSQLIELVQRLTALEGTVAWMKWLLMTLGGGLATVIFTWAGGKLAARGKKSGT